MRLGEPYPLAPRPYFFCRDKSVIGVPFYVLERRKGVVIDDSFPVGSTPTRELGRNISRTVVDTLVELHAVDWKAAWLSNFGPPEGFLQRQVEAWAGHYERAKTEETPEAEQLVRWLSENVPKSPSPTIAHHDFKLNNMLLNLTDLTEVRAVLDWEMTTIGDPLFDLAASLSYWVEPEDPKEFKEVLPTVTDTLGFFTRREFMQRYAEKSGRDLSGMPSYMAFAYFKLAVILQQIYARWKKDQTENERFAAFGECARNLVLHAHALSQGRPVSKYP